MQRLTQASWDDYVERLSKLSKKAGEQMREYIDQHGTNDPDGLIAYANALVVKYSEGSAELAAQMYDAIAVLQGAAIAAAEPAAVVEYGTVAKAVNGLIDNPEQIQHAVERLVKLAAADTTLKNAKRDGAEFAWIPHGDTCAFCITLASNGWQNASKAALKGGHAEHIHANCDCEYAIRFNSDMEVSGYDSERYRAQYYEAGGLNGLRRVQYAKNKDRINAQKRAAYAKRKVYANSSENAIIIEKIRVAAKLPKNAVIHLEPISVDIDALAFDDVHINQESFHHIREEQAKQYIRDAKISVTVWNGQFERYYGLEGSAYVDLTKNEIRTAYSSDEYDENTLTLIEEMKKNGVLK